MPKAPLRMRGFFSSVRVLFAGLLFTAILLGVCVVWLSDMVALDHNGALDSIIDHHDKDNTLVYARDGQLIAEVFSRYRVYVPYEYIPQTLIDAVLAIEDRNFFTHRGVDVRAIARAMWHNLREGKIKQGASTITQQVIKNFSLHRRKVFRRKIREIILAIELERILPKERIMAIYLNNLFLGNRSYGVGAAAQRYFGKKLAELNLAETAMIAGLFRSPSRHDPTRFPQRARRRQMQVLRAMVATNKITQTQMEEAAQTDINYRPFTGERSIVAPYFTDYVVKRAAQLLQWETVRDQGLRIYTTLDVDSQVQAREVINNIDNILKPPQPDMEVALLSVDPHTGEIRTMVGGRDYHTSKFNRTVQAKRPAGSAFKPIVYSYALSKGMTWSDINFVAPISIDAYRPREHREEFIKETTLYRSFYKSLNLPVIELGKKFGINRIIEYAHQFGIESKLKGEMGTVLGSSDMKMTELANAYAVFANSGTLVDQIAITEIVDRNNNILYTAPSLEKRQISVISPQVSYLMTAAMQDVFRRGTASRFYGFHRWAAGKTGTSDDAKDNWFCGYSRNLVTIVWMGKDDFAQKNSARTFGATVALPIWARFMERVTPKEHRQGFDVPAGVVSAMVNPRYGNLDNRGIKMYFLSNRVPKHNSSPYEALSKNPDFRGLFKWN